MFNVKELVKQYLPKPWKRAAFPTARQTPTIKEGKLHNDLLGTAQHIILFQHATNLENTITMFLDIRYLGFNQAMKIMSANQATAERRKALIQFPQSKDFLSGRLFSGLSGWGHIHLVSPFFAVRAQSGINHIIYAHSSPLFGGTQFEFLPTILYKKSALWEACKDYEVHIYSHFDIKIKANPKKSGIHLFPWFLIVAKEKEINMLTKQINFSSIAPIDKVRLLNMLVIAHGDFKNLQIDLPQCAELFFANLHLYNPRKFESVATVEKFLLKKNTELIEKIEKQR